MEKKSKMFDYWLDVKKQEMEAIIEMIKTNKNIKDEVLIAKLHIEKPFLKREKSMELIQDLKTAEKIKVSPSGEVSLCHSG